MEKQSTEFALLLSRLGKDLFAEPFSNLTRKRQLALLFFSCILILVAANIVEITEGEVAGIGFRSTSAAGLVVLLMSLSGGTLVVFWLAATSDYRLRKYRRLPAMNSATEFVTELLTKHQDNVKQAEELNNQINLRVEKREELFEELKALNHEESDKLYERWKEVNEIIRTDGTDELSDELWQLALGEKSSEKIELFTSAYQRTKKLDIVRFWIEVAFPSVLAIVAIGIGIVWFIQLRV